VLKRSNKEMIYTVRVFVTWLIVHAKSCK